jgi:hypothetical protein
LVDLSRVHKKLGEADYFLQLLTKQEQRFVGDKEPFDFLLSAFLSAARSVDYRLRHENATVYSTWTATWDATLRPDERTLIKFMIDDRNTEVHESGSGRDVGQEGVVFPIGTHRIDGGEITIAGPPGMPPAVVHRPTYSFNVDGTVRKATEACAAYLALLNKMVAKFHADFP